MSDREVKVTIPGQIYMGPAEEACWEMMGTVIGAVQRAMRNDELAFSIILSRVSREMRRTWDTETAKAILQGFVDTWTDKIDLP